MNDLGATIFVLARDIWIEVTRTFAISEYLELYRADEALRPQNYLLKRFFINDLREKCSRQDICIDKIGRVPSDVAKFLKLPYPEQYTGHCFRRSSVFLQVETGADLLTFKLHGGWKSFSVAEGYIENSFNKKMIFLTEFYPSTIQTIVLLWMELNYLRPLKWDSNISQIALLL